MRNELADVFKHTRQFYKVDSNLIECCEKTKSNQKFYKSHIDIPCNKNRFDTSMNIIVSKKRTFQAAEQYSKNGQKVAVLNFANSFSPGGGVVEGARAQEECLCRISTLYDSLTSFEMMEKFYQPHRTTLDDLGTDDVIYSPEVMVFKTDTDMPELLPETEWYKADVMTCAAPCLGWNAVSITEEEIKKLHYSRAKQILDVAAANEVDVVVLGAFGCGAFRNPPEVVAEVYKEILNDYSHAFKTVEFAIYCGSYETKNYQVFNRVINS